MYKGFLMDLDGVAYLGKEGIDSCKDFVKRCQAKHIPFCFITNNSTRSNQVVCDHLNSLGYNITVDNVITTSEVTCEVIQSIKPKAKIYMIGMDGLREELVKNQFELVESGADFVIVGLDFNLTYDKLKRACQEIQNGATFIATNSDLTLKTEEGIIPENGSVCQLITAVTGVEPRYIGKPQVAMYEFGLKKLNVEKSEVAMIGDNYLTDIQGAINFGIDSIFVETGVMSREDLESYSIKPTHIVPDLSYFKI